MTSHGSTLGGVAEPPVGPEPPGPPGTVALFSAMTVLPLGRQHDRRPGAGDAPDPVQRVDGGLECLDVRHADLEDVALAAGHPPAVLHLREIPQARLHAGVVD